MRICALLPGATEVLAALGLADDPVGISDDGGYPPEVRHNPVLVDAAIDPEHTAGFDIDRQVRATLEAAQPLYTLDVVRFAQAQPDLVITQDLCHVCAVTPDQLQHAIGALPTPPRVLSLNPGNLDETVMDVERIGEPTRRAALARALAAQLRARLPSIGARIASVRQR